MTCGRRVVKRPFLILSPNKTWEGFIGALRAPRAPRDDDMMMKKHRMYMYINRKLSGPQVSPSPNTTQHPKQIPSQPNPNTTYPPPKKTPTHPAKGAFFFTLLWAFWFSGFLSRFPYFTCSYTQLRPSEDFTLSELVPGSAFEQAWLHGKVGGCGARALICESGGVLNSGRCGCVLVSPYAPPPGPPRASKNKQQ